MNSVPIPCKPLSEDKFAVSSSLDTDPSNGIDEDSAKSLDSGELKPK